MSTVQSKTNVKFLAQIALLIAIEAIIAFTPLGSIPIGPGIVATIAHVPVIIATVVLGLKGGLILGATFGTLSFIIFSTTLLASPLAFLFTPLAAVGDVKGNFLSLIICFVPRMLIAVVCHYLFKLISKFDKLNITSYFVAGFLASVAHTLLVVGLGFLFFPQAKGILLSVSTAIIITNGIPEAIIGGLLALLVGKTVKKVVSR